MRKLRFLLLILTSPILILLQLCSIIVSISVIIMILIASCILICRFTIQFIYMGEYRYDSLFWTGVTELILPILKFPIWNIIKSFR
jgi:uncharacterized membrane protein